MPGQKGNKGGGRRGFGEELARFKEQIVKMTIEELATTKLYTHLETIKEKTDRQGIKEIVLPVYLKSKADIKEHTGSIEIKTITGMEIINENQI